MNNTERDKLSIAINESQSDFEKNLVYLSSGALAISIGFVENIIDLKSAAYLWLLIVSWGCLAVALILNLATHLISVNNSTKARREMDEGLKYKVLIKQINDRNKIMRILNWVTFTLFALGVLFTVVFCSLNF
jgi:hypothetical protein